MCAGQGKDPCPGYVAHVGVVRCDDIIVDDLEEIKALGLQVGGGHACEGLAGVVPLEDDGIAGLLVALLGLLVTLRLGGGGGGGGG